VSDEGGLRELLAMLGASLFARGFAPGTSGNMSVRADDGWLITPTNTCLGRLTPATISKVDAAGERLSGAPPSKEVFLHLAVYQAQSDARAVVHLHSTYCVAVSCLLDVDADDVLPPITPYYVMRIGRLPLVPYFPPGDLRLAEAVRTRIRDRKAALLANHGSIVAGTSLESAVSAAEELEETAKLFLILKGQQVGLLTPAQVEELHKRFPGV
jgi:ribulose-5-phosphate 4-epimerase/fuculose-1-phosphate aldolase